MYTKTLTIAKHRISINGEKISTTIHQWPPYAFHQNELKNTNMSPLYALSNLFILLLQQFLTVNRLRNADETVKEFGKSMTHRPESRRLTPIPVRNHATAGAALSRCDQGKPCPPVPINNDDLEPQDDFSLSSTL